MSKFRVRFPHLRVGQLLAIITALTVFSYTTSFQPLRAAETHVVPLDQVRQDLNSSRATRAQNLADIERVLSLPAAQDALAKAHLTTARATTAIAELNDAELSRLADRARDAEQDVQGGLIVGILALIGLVVVILVVLSVVHDNKD